MFWSEVGCLLPCPNRKGVFFCHNIRSALTAESCDCIVLSRRSYNYAHSTNTPESTSMMAPWYDFDSIFYFNRQFSYDAKVIEHIVSNRRALENQLFVDRLLGLTGVRAGRFLFLLPMACADHLACSGEFVSPKVKWRPPISRSSGRLRAVGHPSEAGLDILHLAGLPRTQRCCHSLCAPVLSTREVQAVYRGTVESGQTRIQGMPPVPDYARTS